MEYFHVGCGQFLYSVKDGETKTMSIACSCGAMAPIATRDLERMPDLEKDPLPSTLWRIIQGMYPKENLPHLEYYLGFSSFSCPAKTEWETQLKAHGLYSMKDCIEPACKRRAERMMVG